MDVSSLKTNTYHCEDTTVTIMGVSIPRATGFTGPQIGAALTVVGGATALMWAVTSERRGLRKEGELGGHSSQDPSERTGQQSRKDAMIVHPRPSADAKTKNSQPTASKFV
ncbi:hypothetical protein AGABI2DRAFT_120272 [Agaricus bisporus var. bisporus H97]|uniref:hypothetical protein n=1 Tax=Agaricus bisporus var. bisporus (strain H97 / ATCC MYA-4626 / FGSC 10389) TaxID=936046 RepID=UPI00029F572A|nr:hypothetical protein AGABI2DRAFT_120272 [Agaricus bisporus var. bisporus H97]EKV45312.1 hypothetical protein AGABI2DRAFT_120272 [Agaricus bisporus var. bisporus H97]